MVGACALAAFELNAAPDSVSSRVKILDVREPSAEIQARLGFVEYVYCDVTDLESLTTKLMGCTAVVLCASVAQNYPPIWRRLKQDAVDEYRDYCAAFDRTALCNALKAADTAKVARFIYVGPHRTELTYEKTIPIERINVESEDELAGIVLKISKLNLDEPFWSLARTCFNIKFVVWLETGRIWGPQDLPGAEYWGELARMDVAPKDIITEDATRGMSFSTKVGNSIARACTSPDTGLMLIYTTHEQSRWARWHELLRQAPMSVSADDPCIEDVIWAYPTTSGPVDLVKIDGTWWPVYVKSSKIDRVDSISTAHSDCTVKAYTRMNILGLCQSIDFCEFEDC